MIGPIEDTDAQMAARRLAGCESRCPACRVRGAGSREAPPGDALLWAAA